MINDLQFAAHIAKALEFRARGDHAKFAIYCRGLKSLYRRQNILFDVEETTHHVAFSLRHPKSKLAYARHLHRDLDRPILKLVLPAKGQPGVPPS